MRPARRPTEGEQRVRHDLGLMGVALSLIALPPFVLAVAEMIGGEAVSGGAHALALAPLVLVGAVGAFLSRGEGGGPRRGGGALATLALGWLLAAPLAALPLWLAALLDPAPSATLAAFANPAVALFEGTSGITGSGLSVSRDPSELLPSMQLYRSLMQWIGAIGLLLCGLAVADRSRSAYERHEHQIGAELTTDTLAEEVHSPIGAVWVSYAVLTVLAATAFLLSGMPPWESLNHALAGISTGGFTITADSFQSYGTAPLVAGAGVMVLGALSFGVHVAILGLRPPRRSERPQLWGYLAVLGAGLPLVWLFAVAGAPGALSGAGTQWGRAAFQWTSALTTTGFSAAPLETWSPGGLLLLSFGMFLGACSGSTGGGLKMRRAITITIGIGHRVRAAARDGEDDEDSEDEGDGENDGGSEENDETLSRRVRDSAARLSLLTVVLGAGLLAILLGGPEGAPFSHALLDATAALSTAGLTTGFVGPDLSAGTLLAFCALMLLGRLEVIAMLVLALMTLRRARPSRTRIGRTRSP